MTHLYKIQLPNSDMFIKEINFETFMIKFQVREKDNGKLLEAETYMPFTVNESEQKIEFGARFINLGLSLLVEQTLKP